MIPRKTTMQKQFSQEEKVSYMNLDPMAAWSFFRVSINISRDPAIASYVVRGDGYGLYLAAAVAAIRDNWLLSKFEAD